jgi:hypothetical protein
MQDNEQLYYATHALQNNVTPQPAHARPLSRPVYLRFTTDGYAPNTHRLWPEWHGQTTRNGRPTRSQHDGW